MTGSFSFPDPEGDDGLEAARVALRPFFIVASEYALKPVNVHLALLEAVAATGTTLESAYPNGKDHGEWNARSHEILDMFWAAFRASGTDAAPTDAGGGA